MTEEHGSPGGPDPTGPVLPQPELLATPAVGYIATIKTGEGELRYSGDLQIVSRQLRADLLHRRFAGSDEVRVEHKDSEGKWQAKSHTVNLLPALRPFYRPAQHRLLRGMQVGIGAGVSLESLHQGWNLYRVYNTPSILILFFLPVVIFLGFVFFEEAIGKIMGWLVPAVIAGAFMTQGQNIASMKGGLDSFAGLLAPTFAALVTASFSGAVMGSAAGLVLAGASLFTGPQPTAAHDAPRATRTLAATTLAIFVPVLGGLAYGYTRWAHRWPVQAEASVRDDLKSDK